VNADATAAALSAAGYSDGDAASRAALLDRARVAFQQQFGRPGVWRWFVPGRIEVFGKHTDYAGGRSLMTAVPRGFAVVAAPRGDRVVSVCDAADGSRLSLDPDAGAAKPSGWDNYVATVVGRLAANFPAAPLGVDIAILSDLPRAAGLSSSSALVVGIASALIRRGGLEQMPQWSAIASAHQLAWYLGCVENGLDYPGLPGAAGVGTLGGSEDHTAILTCRAGHLSQNRYAPIAHLGDVPLPPDWTFVVATSGVRADKTGAALDRYNRLSQATAVLRNLWHSEPDRPAVSSLAAALVSLPDAEARLRESIDGSHDAHFDRAALARRLTHFIREDGRVPEAAQAFAAGDAARITSLAEASQAEADTLLGNQIDETRSLVCAALETGAVAAASFGAGFGGSVWALSTVTDAERLGREWVAAYYARCPHVGFVDWFVAPPGPARLAL
jgi:galactokinase